MKKKILTISFMALIAWIIPGCSTGFIAQDNSGNNNPNYTVNNNQDNNSDYDEYNVDDLNQYGEWVNINEYGRVWHPSVIDSWQPFTNGHWTYDGNDWVWVSYEPFGWIVYHYGSWENSPDYGWIWIPGRDAWSPARVQWIDYGDNIGWAPMRANNRQWSEPWENNSVHPWMVVRMEDFNRENIISYNVPTVSRSNNNQNQIQRRQPDLKIVQSHIKEPIKIVKIDKEPTRIETPPVRNSNPQVVTPPVKNDNPTYRPDPPRNDNPPVKTNTPVQIDNPPVRTNTPPVINRNTTNVRTPNTRNIIHMQVPQEEKQKVDRYQPKVVKDVLIKKNPRPVINTAPKSDGRNNNNDKKSGDDKR
ncbi:MAG: hypothetical protein P4L35_09230 [Ignavibacteriaceae bacterium]|nr:hypothetical protein [Ignavibacteriaceae bacterium]